MLLVFFAAQSILSGTSVVQSNTTIPNTATLVISNPVSIISYEDNGRTGMIFADGDFLHVVRFFDDGNTISNLSIVVNNWTGDYIHLPMNMFLDLRNGNNLYLVDYGFYRVLLFSGMQSINPLPQVILGISGSSGSGAYELGTPIGIAVDNQSRIYVSDKYLQYVMRWSPNATHGVIIAGNGTAGGNASQLSGPGFLYLDEVNSWLYVADMNNNRIQRYSLNGSFPAIGVTVAGGNGQGYGRNQLYHPYSFWVSRRTNTIYIADYYNGRIQRWKQGDTKGVTVAGSVDGSPGSDATSLLYPSGVTLNANETFMYVTDSSNSRIQRFRVL